MRSRYDYRISDADIVIVVIKEILQRILTQITLFLNNPKTHFPAVEEALSFIGYKYDINKFISKSGFPTDQKFYNNSVIGAIEFAIITLNDEIENLIRRAKSFRILFT